MSRYFITGANRGIGLALTNLILENGHRVMATCRDPQRSTDLKLLKQAYGERLEILVMNVVDDDDIAELSRNLSESHAAIDVLINNAGASNGLGSDQSACRRHDLLRLLDINAVSPLLITQKLVPCLQRGESPLVVNVSSILGSITLTDGLERPMDYAYNSSKAALNMISRIMTEQLKPHGIGVLIVHPGWVKTDMGGSEAPMIPRDSAERIYQHIQNFDLAQTGRYVDPDGNILPW